MTRNDMHCHAIVFLKIFARIFTHIYHASPGNPMHIFGTARGIPSLVRKIAYDIAYGVTKPWDMSSLTLVFCWPTAYDVGPTANQRWANVLCLPVKLARKKCVIPPNFFKHLKILARIFAHTTQLYTTTRTSCALRLARVIPSLVRKIMGHCVNCFVNK